jgi:hypothetical protein
MQRGLWFFFEEIGDPVRIMKSGKIVQVMVLVLSAQNRPLPKIQICQTFTAIYFPFQALLKSLKKDGAFPLVSYNQFCFVSFL